MKDIDAINIICKNIKIPFIKVYIKECECYTNYKEDFICVNN